MSQHLISILHPSRGRPQKSVETIQNWIARAGDVPIEVIVSVDEDDPALQNYYDCHVAMLTVNNNRSAVDAINAAASKAKGNILIVVSDDTDCPENWANDLLKCLGGKSDFIAKTTDGIQGWIITMPIMDRAYYNRFGYVYFPDYRHMFCDTELTCVADLTDRKIDIPLTFEHLHYSVGKSEKDAISEKADATWSQGEKLFLERYKRNFDLKETPGKITSRQYLSWIEGKL